jgi:hypothetical protein
LNQFTKGKKLKSALYVKKVFRENAIWGATLNQFTKGKSLTSAMHVKKVFRTNPIWVDTLNRFMKTKKLASKNKWDESFPCKDFNKRYSFKSLLVKHKVTVHEGYESHHFRYCNASFTSNLLRNEHNKFLPCVLVTLRYLT